MKKNLIWICLGLFVAWFSSSARADSPQAYGYASGIPIVEHPVLLHRAGSSDEGIAWTEETVWRPDGGYDVIGNQYGDDSFDSNYYIPPIPGTYWVQLRVVDNDIDFTDYWYSFDVRDMYYYPPENPPGN